MRGVKWLMVLGVAGCLGWAGREAAGQSAPAAPTYVGVERTIESIRQAWAKPGARPEPNADGWNALFDALLERLAGVRPGQDDAGRLTALNRIYEISAALATVAWPPAATLREEVREWLRPRVRLAWARRRLSETVTSLPPASDPAAQANRTRWVDFVAERPGRGAARLRRRRRRCSSDRRRSGGSTRPSPRSTGRTRGSRARGGRGSHRGSSRPR